MTVELLEKAAEEIRTLRRANEILAAKVEMIELFATVLYTQPARKSEGMAEDIAWQIDRWLEKDRAD